MGFLGIRGLVLIRVRMILSRRERPNRISLIMILSVVGLRSSRKEEDKTFTRTMALTTLLGILSRLKSLSFDSNWTNSDKDFLKFHKKQNISNIKYRKLNKKHEKIIKKL